jgi:hypothetical protein
MPIRDMTYDVLITAVSHPTRMDGERLRGIYDWCVTSFSNLALEANTFSVDGAGFDGKGYRDFARGRKRLERADFGALLNLSVCRFRQKQNSMTIGWELECANLRWEVGAGRELRTERSGQWHTLLCMSPDLLGIEEGTCLDLATTFARMTVDQGGCIFFMHRNRGPTYYATGMGYDPVQYPNDRTVAENENISTWSYGRHIHLTRPWLRDVYPINFLGRQLAAMPVEGVALADWLRADVARGTVEPFPCEGEPNALLWKPPLGEIPALRERLYRAGLIWHRQYYLDARDGKAPPFVPADPVPEILRAEFYRGWDPKLTR